MRQGHAGVSGAHRGLTLAILTVMVLASTAGTLASSDDEQTLEPCAAIDDLQFNGTRANASVAWQVDLGPRTPGSNASADLRNAITTNLEVLGYNVTTQTHQRYGMELTNLFARWSSLSLIHI